MTETRPRSAPAWFRNSRKKAALNERWFYDAKGRQQKNNWHHVRWFDLAEQHDRLLIEAAREHSKTQVFATTQPLVEIARDPNIRILIISDVDEKSQERCRVLREHINNNARFREDCPHIRVVRKDGDHKFWVERDRYWLKEATVTSTYAGAPISGGRYDLILPDDLVNYLLNANTPGKRRKMSRWWNDDVLNSVALGGRVWAIGTHQHPDDLYEEVKRDPSFRFEVFPAVDEEDTGYGYLGYREQNEKRGIEGADAICLWPQAHDYETHMAKKNTPSQHDSYLRQQQQLAVPETGLVYRKPLMDAAFERGKHVEYDGSAVQFVSVDPGYSIRAVMLCVQERAGDRVDLWAEHSFTQMADDEIAEVVAEHCVNHNVLVAYYDAEDPGLGRAIEKALERRGYLYDPYRKRGGTRVQKVPFGKYKRLAIKATRWLLQTGRLSWKGETTTVHTPGRVQVEPSIYRRETLSYALKDGEDDEPMKADDHGPDAWTAYAAKWIEHWAKSEAV